MAQIVKLKRTSVEGKVPSTSNLQLGELAINTHDGRIFFKKNDGSDSVEQIVTTNSVTTGSFEVFGTLTLDTLDAAEVDMAGGIMTGLQDLSSEATSLMINGSGTLGTRELGSNAFNSTTIPTNNNQLTNGAGYATGDNFDEDGTFSSLRAQGTTKGDVGLGNVTNESKSTMFTSPTFTGTPLSTTPSANDNSTKIATTAYVQTELTDLVGNAPAAFDTLGEISASLAADSGALDSLTTVVSGKLQKDQNLSDLTNVSTARTNLGVDAAGTDNSTDVTLANTNYLSLSGQQLTGGTVPIGSGGTGATTAGAARTALGVDAAGTDNSTDVTLGGSYDYITISGQTITRNQIDLTTDVTGVLPSANLDADTAHLSGTQTFTGTKTFTKLGVGSSHADYDFYNNGTSYLNGAVTVDSTLTANTIYIGSTNTSSFLSGDSKLSIDGYMMVKGLVNTNETGTGPAAITFGNGSTLGTDEISLIAAGNTKIFINTSRIDLQDEVNVNDTTQSTSKTTGALIVDGGVGIAKTLNVGEDVVAYASSDERYKDNVTPIENPNEKLKQIGGYTFDWNDKHEVFKGQHDVGVIAQEIEKVLPEIVETRESGYKAVKYEKIVALLIESNKELLKRVEELESKIK